MTFKRIEMETISLARSGLGDPSGVRDGASSATPLRHRVGRAAHAVLRLRVTTARNDVSSCTPIADDATPGGGGDGLGGGVATPGGGGDGLGGGGANDGGWAAGVVVPQIVKPPPCTE